MEPAVVEEVCATGEVRGRVLEYGSGRPLASARIRVGGQEILPDAAGRFRLDLPLGPVTIEADDDEHRPGSVERVVVPGSVEVVLRLQRYDWQGDEVVVFGARSPRHPERIAVGVAELRQIPGSLGDPIRALQSLPSVARPPELSGQLAVRGSEPLATVTRVDGVDVPFLYHLVVGRSVIEPAMLEAVDFWPGGLPAAVGNVGQALVEVRTLEAPAEPGLHGTIELDPLDGGGSVGLRLSPSTTVWASGRIGWAGAVITGATWLARALRSSDERPATVTFPYEDHLVRLVHRSGPDLWSATVFGAADALVQHPSGDEPSPEPSLGYDPDRLVADGFERVRLAWRRERGPQRSLVAVAGGPEHQQNLVADLGAFGIPGAPFTRTTGWLASATARHERPLGRTVALAGGADGSFGPQATTLLLDPEAPPTVSGAGYAGAWAEVSWSSDRWTVTPGARASFHLLESVEAVPEPRLALSWRPAPVWTASVTAGRTSQSMRGPGLGAGVLAEVQSGASLRGDWPSGLSVSVGGYETELPSVPWQGTALRLGSRPREPDRLELLPVLTSELASGRAWGAEVWVRLQPRSSGAFGWIGVSGGQSWRIVGGERVRADGDLPANAVAVGSVALPGELRVSVRGELGSGRVYTPSEPVWVQAQDLYAPIPGAPNGARFPPYARLDLRLERSWTAPRARWTAFLDLRNATNHRNPIVPEYDWSYRVPTVVSYVPILPSLGIRVVY